MSQGGWGEGKKKARWGAMGRGKRGSDARPFPLFPLSPARLLLFIHGYPVGASGEENAN